VNLLFILGLTQYIPLVIVAFFYPLSGAHEATKKSKAQELETLSLRFNQIYDKLLIDVKNENFTRIPTDMDILNKLDVFYFKAEKMPVWPFDTETITKFGSILAAIITSIWLNRLFGITVQM